MRLQPTLRGGRESWLPEVKVRLRPPLVAAEAGR